MLVGLSKMASSDVLAVIGSLLPTKNGFVESVLKGSDGECGPAIIAGQVGVLGLVAAVNEENTEVPLTPAG